MTQNLVLASTKIDVLVEYVHAPSMHDTSKMEVRYVDSQGRRRFKQIKCADLSKDYTSALRYVLPHAQILRRLESDTWATFSIQPLGVS